jgi:hypothetical protein
VVGYTFRFRFDTTKVKPDDILNHQLGKIIPAPDSVQLFQTIAHDYVQMYNFLKDDRKMTKKRRRFAMHLLFLRRPFHKKENPDEIYQSTVRVQ